MVGRSQELPPRRDYVIASSKMAVLSVSQVVEQTEGQKDKSVSETAHLVTVKPRNSVRVF